MKKENNKDDFSHEDIGKDLSTPKEERKVVTKQFYSQETLADIRFQKVRSIEMYRMAHREIYERQYGGISKVYYRKILEYGNFIDLLIYDVPKITHKQKGRQSYAKKLDKEKRDDSIGRTKQNIFRIVHSNVNKWGTYKAIFYTLTFAENLTDVKVANKHFGLFIKRLEYNLNYKLKHLTIIEFQKRGAVHYHGIFFNLEYIPVKEFEKIWGHGFSNIQTFEIEKAISSYLTKYMNKESNDKRLYGQRSYLASQKLHKPKETYDDGEVDYILNCPKEIISEYSNNGKGFKFKRHRILDKDIKSDRVTNNKS